MTSYIIIIILINFFAVQTSALSVGTSEASADEADALLSSSHGFGDFFILRSVYRACRKHLWFVAALRGVTHECFANVKLQQQNILHQIRVP